MDRHRLLRHAAPLLLAVASVTSVRATPVAELVGHRVAGRQPTTVTLLDAGRRVAVTNRGDESVWIYDAATLEVVARHSLVGRHGAWAVAEPQEGLLLVSNWKGESLSVLDAATGEVTGSIPVGIKPSYVALSPDGARAYVAGHLSGDVSLVDVAGRTPVRILEVGQRPMGVAASTDGRWLYVASCRSRKVSKVDLKYEVVLSSFGAPLAETSNLVVTPDGAMLLAAGDDDRLLLIDAETGRTDKVKVGRGPAAVALSPDGRWAFVACYDAAAVVATDGRRLYSVSDQAAALSVFQLGEVEPAAIPPAVEATPSGS
jgi:YVTN family beta-propeller protein